MIIFLSILIGGLFMLISVFKNNKISNPKEKEIIDKDITRTFLPNTNGEIIHKKQWSYSVLNNSNLTEWSAYILDKSILDTTQNVYNEYIENTDIFDTLYHSGKIKDIYKAVQIVPKSHFGQDSATLIELNENANTTFQFLDFNQNIWQKFDQTALKWIEQHDQLYIISGPIWYVGKEIDTLQNVSYPIPHAFFKVILVYQNNQKSGVGFVFPHDNNSNEIATYMMSINAVENITGFDFFNEMINDKEEELIESTLDPTFWKFD